MFVETVTLQSNKFQWLEVEIQWWETQTGFITSKMEHVLAMITGDIEKFYFLSSLFFFYSPDWWGLSFRVLLHWIMLDFLNESLAYRTKFIIWVSFPLSRFLASFFRLGWEWIFWSLFKTIFLGWCARLQAAINLKLAYTFFINSFSFDASLLLLAVTFIIHTWTWFVQLVICTIT